MCKCLKKVLSAILILSIVFTTDILPSYAYEEDNGYDKLSINVKEAQPGQETLVGDQVTLIAEASGGDGSYEYQFTLENGEDITVVQDYSNLSQYTFTAEQQGNYVFQVTVKDGTEQTETCAYELEAKMPENNDMNEPDSTSEDNELDNVDIPTEVDETTNGEQPGRVDEPKDTKLPTEVNTLEQPKERLEIKESDNTNVLQGYLSSDSGSTVSVGQEITLTALYNGGIGKVEYRFTEEYNGVAKTVKVFSEDATYTFKATQPGIHIYHLAVRDEGGQALSTKYSINVVVPSNKKLSGKLVSSSGTTANVEEEVTLTADCAGGYGKVEYRFTEEYNGVAKTVKAFSEDTTYTFEATQPGIHTYHLAVRDEEGQSLSTKYSINVVVPSNKKLSGKLVSSSGTTANVEEEVTLTADCAGGYGKVEYRFTEEYNGVAKTVKAFSEDTTYTFKATQPGIHTYHLAVRDEEGQSLSTKYSISVIVPAEKKLHATLKSDMGVSADVGTNVTLYASYTGGYDDIEFRFTEVYNGVAKTVQAYGDEDTYSFRATNPGVHKFNLAVRDSEGQVTSVSYSITVTVPVEKQLYGTLTSNKTTREYVDRIVTLTGGYSGGYGDVEYRFTEVYNGVAKTVQAYSENNEYTFRTTKPGVHTYYLALRDKEGQIANATYSITVVVHPDYKLTGTFTKNVSQTVKENVAVTLTANASKGYGAPYLYRFTETYNGKSKTVQNYSTDNTYSFTISGGGIHKYTVAIQDCEGQTISYSLTISVGKNGWYYENGYKFYYKDNVKQLDLDGILPKQSSYYIKVNRTACTITVYAKDGNNGYIIPVKRFACSVGLPSTPTPTGTYYTSDKYRWHTLMGPSYGQYCTRVVNGIFFHSVAGYNMTSYNLNARDYNNLGSPASHGCIRLCVRDAKWIYDNCSSGTRVTIYDSSDPGPLGKPSTIKIPSWQNWDPTDPNL
mgnify:FL=1